MVFPDSASLSAVRRPAAPYARVKQFLKEELARGRWVPGALMPSDAELVAQFGVSRMTVTRALRELQSEGLVDRLQGVGTFAAHLYRVSSTLTIRDLHEEIVSRGHRTRRRCTWRRASARRPSSPRSSASRPVRPSSTR
jgi:GntR family histidine utilization transcriptional repressor